MESRRTSCRTQPLYGASWMKVGDEASCDMCVCVAMCACHHLYLFSCNWLVATSVVILKKSSTSVLSMLCTSAQQHPSPLE